MSENAFLVYDATPPALFFPLHVVLFSRWLTWARIALEKLDYDLAASEKHRLEEAQRHKKKERDEKELPWVPKYFV